MKIPPPWTKEQWEAISARNCDLLVSAAAGAGKTAVLVERISRLITDPQNPVDLNQLLVVTFTEAAAREMKERIGLKLRETLAHHPEDYRLAMQLTMLDSAAISTIHAFCLSIMRRYFYELELDPAFRVLDEAESILLRGELVDDLFNRLYREGDPRFIEVVDSFGGFDTDGALKAMVGQLYDFSRSMPDPAGWLDAALDNLDDLGLWQDLACKQTAMALTCLIEDYLYVQRLCQNHGLNRYGDLLSEELLLFDELRQSAQQDNWTLLTSLVEEVAFRTLPRVKDADQRVKEAVQAVRTEAKDLMVRLRTEYLRPEGLGAELSRAKELLAIISNLVSQFGQSYREEKLRRGKVDFSDLEHYCLRLLRMPQIQRDLAGCYRYVLVDEYQDINGVQEEILNLCAQGADRFMVGDIKQSIYRFRLADPGLFLAKYERFTPEDTDKKRVDLSTNFRCQRQIINAVNYIFRQLFSKEVGELEYDLQAELLCGRQDASEPGTTKFHLVEGDIEDKELYPGIEAAHREALVMAAEIREMVGSLSVYDKGQKELRPATYSDIVILVRSMTHSDKIMEVFDRCGIPAHVELSGGYFGATEVQTILSLLKVIDNPRQDIPLVGVLRSPIVGLTAEELGRLRIKSPETDFYDCLLEEGCGEKVQKFLEQLEDFRTVAQRCPLNQLIWHIYRETGYYDYVTGLPNGAQRRANLRALYDRALQFEEFSQQGLFRFLQFIGELEAKREDMAPACAVGEKDDVVRIMSVHKSKGLEFPIVFVGGLGTKFNFSDLYGDVLWSKELGLGPKIADLDLRFKYPSLPWILIRDEKRALALSEEMRILYVALTRARDHLILVGTVGSLEGSCTSWSRSLGVEGWTLPTSMRLQASSYLDWLGPAVIRHRSGTVLQDIAQSNQGDNLQVQESDVDWEIKLWRGEELSLLEEQVTTEQGDLSIGGDDLSLWKELEQILSWEYPYWHLAGIPAKLTVTEVTKRTGMTDEEEDLLALAGLHQPRRPVFVQGRGMTPTEYGTAVHTVLQHLHLNPPMNRTDVEQELARLVEKRIISKEQAREIEIESLVTFFESSLGQRLLAATRVQREIPFTCMMPARTLLQKPVDEPIVLQGVVDCLFLDAISHKWVLIDFKSDQGGIVPKRLEAYRKQIKIYREALLLQDWPVDEGYLCFLSTDQILQVF